MGNWSKLKADEKVRVIKFARLNGVSDIKTIRDTYNLYSSGNLVDNLYAGAKRVERGETPNYNNTISEQEAERLGYFRDDRGHRDDRVKLPNHPTHPSKGTFVDNRYDLSDRGIQDVNHTLFGLVDNGDGYAIPTYKGSTVLPEITVTPNGNYVHNTYDNIKLHYAKGGPLVHKKSGKELRETLYLKLDDAANYKAYEDATNYFLNLGFGPELASKYAIDRVHNNMTFDAGMLPEINVTAQAWGDGDNASRRENYQKACKAKREKEEKLLQHEMNQSIREATDKWGKGIGLGMITAASVPVLSGAMAGMNAIRAAHPIATGLWDAYWAGDGIVRNLFGDSGVKKTYNLIKEGDTWGALKSGTGDALDLLGVTDVFSLGNKIINPLYRSAHAYNTIPQYGYKDTLSRFKNWSRAVLSGTDPNVMNEALWVEDLRKRLQMNNMLGMPYLSALADVNKNAAVEIGVRGRDEASRLYNHLPSRHQYYIPNGDGSYRYNLEKIQQDWKQLSGEDYFPLPVEEFYDEALATSGHHGFDVITGAGGNLTGNSFIGKVTVGDMYDGGEEFGIKLIEDMQDAHPFRRDNRQFSNWLQKSVLDKTSKKIRNKANNIYTKLFDLTNKGLDYGNTKLNRFWYNYLGGRPLNKLRYETNLQLPGYIKEGVIKKPGPFWQKVNTTMSDFEVGSLTGATPFLMRTKVPYTRTSQLVPRKDIPYFVDNKIILGHHSDKYFIPSIIDPYSIQGVDNFLLFNTTDFTNLKSTGGPLYPFSFEKNPFLKTPVVRYDLGGELDSWEQEALSRANRVYSNYEQAVDNKIPLWRIPLLKLLKNLGLPSGLSNCTLSATLWVDPNNPIMSAATIFNSPSSGYTKINSKDAIPGNLLITKNPETGGYHTMMIEGFTDSGEPILRYSNGDHTLDALRTNITLSEYHRRDNNQGGNHTEDHYFRYNYPNEVFLPEVTVWALKGHKKSGKEQEETQSLNTRKVDIDAWYAGNNNRKRGVNTEELKLFQDSLIANNIPLELRLAILGTSAQETGTEGAASYGIGGMGLLGLSGQRMDSALVSHNPDTVGMLIHFLILDLKKRHSDNWLEGGTGGPTIKTGKEGFEKFWGGNNVDTVTQVLNKSYIRPAEKLNAWKNRAEVAKSMLKYLK